MLSFAILLASLIFLFLVIEVKSIPSIPIIAAFFVRLALSFLYFYQFLEPPHGDQRGFMGRAIRWSELDWGALFQNFIPDHSYVISAIGALIFKIFGVHPQALILINVFLGTLLVVLTHVLAHKLIGKKRADFVVWFAALFPPTVIHSSIFLREVWASSAFMIGIINIYKWRQFRSPLILLYAILAFSMASCFHGAYAVTFLVIFAFSFSDFLSSFKKSRSKKILYGFISMVILASIIVGVLAYNVTLGSIGNLAENVNDPLAAADSRLSQDLRGGSAYPSWVGGEDASGKVWLIPIRTVYFLFSPFPWDIRSPGHLMGFVSTFVFAYIATSIYKSRHYLYARKDMLIVISLVSLMILVFSIGTGNIGTSIRHRTKFLFPLLALCAFPVSKRVYFQGSRKN